MASSVSGISVHPNSFGAIGAQHASTLSSHIGDVSKHVSTIAERESSHGDNLRQSAQRMRSTDRDAADSFNKISGDAAARNLPSVRGSSTGQSGRPAESTQTSSVSAPPTIRGNNTNPSANDTPTGSRPAFADPIDMTTGRMTLTQVDVELGGVLPLVMSRTHVSSYALGRWFGASWASTVDQRLEVDEDGVYFAAEDGTLLNFPRPVVDAPVLPVSGPRWELSLGEDGSYAITKPETRQSLHFSPAPGNRLPITGIADANGNWARFSYDAGVLTEIMHSGGYRITVVTADGVITALRLAGDEPAEEVDLVRYQYTDGRLTGVVNSSGQPLRFEYDDRGRIVSWTDRNGMWYRYTYDAAGRCVRAEGADGYLDATFTYGNLVHTATNSVGDTTTFRLNERLRIVEQIDPLGNVTRFDWDPFDRLLASGDPLGRTTHYTYDDAGNLTALTRPDGSRRIAEYDEFRVPVTVVDADGAVWRRETDGTGRVTAVVDPTGARTAYGYDDAGNLSSVTDALGSVTRIESNAAGLPVAVTDGVGATTRYLYDRLGRVRQVIDPLGGRTTLSWTVEGLPLSEATPDGAVRRWSYDGEGNVRETTDPLGRVSRTEIAHFDLPVARRDQDGAELRYGYDTELRLTAVTNQLGQRWRYEYDAAGRVVRETDFNGREVRYAYDAAGQLVRRTNAVGQTVTWTWDELGRQVARRAGTDETVFSYDAEDRIMRARNGVADLTFTYDAAGRVLTETMDGRAVTSAYDRLGRRISRRSATGARSAWEYDPAGRPVALRTEDQAILFQRDVAGREVQRRMGAMVVTQAWDETHRLTAQTVFSGNRQVQARRYGYRPDGVLTTVHDELSGSRRYDVDAVGRVTAVHGDSWAERYAYDSAGNITLADQPTSPRRRAAGERQYAGTLISRAGSVSYQHDAEGRMVARHQVRADGRPETWRYTWDAQDQLVGVTTPDGSRWHYLYDPLGRRIAKQRTEPDGRIAERVVFTWDGDQLVEQVHDDTRALVWDWAPNSHQVVSQRERSITGQQAVDQRFFAIVTDLVGTPTELVGPAGDLAWHARSTLWGDLVSEPGAAYTFLRFPGQYHDPETGLHYNHHRYYDPATGRYVSHDPLGLAAAPNSQSYVDNPTGWIDPLGLTPCAAGQLHTNPQGPSLIVHGPNRPATGPNVIGDQRVWGHVVTNSDHPGNAGSSTRPVSVHQDPQTWRDTRGLSAGMTLTQRDSMDPNGILRQQHGGANTLEAMGRRDPATQGYWQQQDARKERLASDAVDIANRNPQRDGLAKVEDTTALVNSTSKIQGMQTLLHNHDGVMIGTAHSTDDAWPFLPNHMGQLKQAGVNTIYTEHIRDDGHQQMVNHYMQSGQMDPGLKSFLDKTPNAPGLENTLTAARAHGVQVQGLGGFPAQRPSIMQPNGHTPDQDAQNHVRASMFNTYATQVVDTHRADMVSQGLVPGKYIIDAGNAHGYNHQFTGTGAPPTVQGVQLPQRMPGIGDILNIPVVKTNSINPNLFEGAWN